MSPPAEIAMFVLGFLLYTALALGPVLGGLYLIYFLVTLPMRRNERARMFLDLLELGLKSGSTPEAALTEAAASRDRSLGVRFHLLAAHLEQGTRLSQALKYVPRLLPQQVNAMLAAGERIGNVPKVLPACRLLLQDGVSQVRGALNYLLLLCFVVTPVAIVVPLSLRLVVLPKFLQVFEGMGAELPPFTRFVFASSPIFTDVQIAFLGLVWVATLAYLGGPRLRGWCQRLAPVLTDRCLGALPWRRKRLQRDFSAMLAVLLDAEVPEPEAVRLAGESTANQVFRRRAADVAAQLERGVKLADAISLMDDSQELRWRLANALRRSGGFVRALTGWHEALDAKAFQSEQAAAQLGTTCLVLFNGFVTGCVVIGMFIVLVSLINSATLW